MNSFETGDNYGDSSGKLWSMYLTEAEKEDKEITDAWKGEADSTLVFVSANVYIPPSTTKAILEDRSVFRHRRSLHH